MGSALLFTLQVNLENQTALLLQDDLADKTRSTACAHQTEHETQRANCGHGPDWLGHRVLPHLVKRGTVEILSLARDLADLAFGPQGGVIGRLSDGFLHRACNFLGFALDTFKHSEAPFNGMQMVPMDCSALCQRACYAPVGWEARCTARRKSAR